MRPYPEYGNYLMLQSPNKPNSGSGSGSGILGTILVEVKLSIQ
jgi:hypothetical protein